MMIREFTWTEKIVAFIGTPTAWLFATHADDFSKVCTGVFSLISALYMATKYYYLLKARRDVTARAILDRANVTGRLEE